MRRSPRTLSWLVASLALTVVGGGCVAAAPAANPSVVGWRQSMLDRVDAERSAAGVASLAGCPRLDTVAQAHSDDQAAHRSMSHTGSDGSTPAQRVTAAGYRWTTVGENVAYGYPDVTAVMNGWMGSAPHRSNVLNPAFVHVGSGRAAATDGRIYWTQVFGAGGTC